MLFPLDLLFRYQKRFISRRRLFLIEWQEYSCRSKTYPLLNSSFCKGHTFCNLNCEYCDLSVESRRTKSAMEPELIGRFFTEVFGSGRLAPEVTVLWHSGEPLTLPPSILRERDQPDPRT